MKKYYILQTSLLLLMMTGTSTFAQVGIGTTSPTAALEINAANEGLIIPRVSLTGTDDIGTVETPTVSELVYNTATTSGPTAVTPGYYYLSTATGPWVRLGTGSGDNSNPSWQLTGNRFTNPDTHFLGTIDGQGLSFRTSNTERMRISATGNVGIGTDSPTEKLEVNTGNIFLNSTARQFIRWGAVGAATGPPVFSANPALRSAGTKLLLWPSINATTMDFAIGIESNAIWHAVAQNTPSFSHKFYGGTTPLMTIRGDGNVGIGTTEPPYRLSINSDLPAYTAGMRPSGGLGLFAGNVANLSGQLGWVRKPPVPIPGQPTPPGAPVLLLQGVQDGVAWRDVSIARDGGNVGIGTGDPTDKLHVAGNVRADSHLIAGGYVFAQYLNTTQDNEILNPATVKSFPIRTTDDYIRMFSAADTRKALGLETQPTFTGSGATAVALASTSSTTAALQLTSPVNTNTTVHISFHRPGLFATNFGLDPDGAFSFGGWSHGNGFAPIKTGNITSSGIITSAANVMVGGNMHNTGGFVYPGQQNGTTVGAYQGSWYLGTHSNYGLWTNTGLYASGGVYTGEWFRNTVAGAGLYNNALGNHFAAVSDADWRITGNADSCGLGFASSNFSTIYGYTYGDRNGIGFLSPGRGWAIRWLNNNTEITGNAVITGNAGISTTTPTATLDVNGSVKVKMVTVTTPNSQYAVTPTDSYINIDALNVRVILPDPASSIGRILYITRHWQNGEGAFAVGWIYGNNTAGANGIELKPHGLRTFISNGTFWYVN